MRPIPAAPSSVDLEPRQVDRLDLAGEGAADPLLGLVALDRGEEADGAEIDAEDRHAGAGEAAQRVQDRAVAAEDEADVRARLGRWRRSMPSAASPCLASSSAVATRRQPASRATRDRDRDRLGGGRRVGVGDQGSGLHSSASTAAGPRGLEVGDRGAPIAAAPDEGLAVALRAGQPRGGDAAHRQAELVGGERRRRGSPRGGRRRRGRRRGRPARLPSSNCGLTIASTSPPGARQRATAGRILASEMKETSTVAKRGGEGQVGGRHRAGVEALDHGHPRILAQAQVELAVGDVDRGHPRWRRAAAGSR